jgi:hypothetical protein
MIMVTMERRATSEVNKEVGIDSNRAVFKETRVEET